MFSKKCKKECFLKNYVYENLNHYTNKFNDNQKIKLYLLYFQILVNKIPSMPTRVRLQKEKEKKLLKQRKAVHQ